MGFWDLFKFDGGDEKRIRKAVAAGEVPQITSVKDLEVYIGCSIEDEEFARLLVGIMGRLGRDGVIGIEKGGQGDPYEVEYDSSGVSEMMSKKERKARIDEVRAILVNESLSEDDLRRRQEELARLVGKRATIWVNCQSDEEYRLREDMFAAAVEVIERFCGGDTDSGDSS